ncbi:MAG: hypothetical protein ACOVO5_08070 [Devosia sp.]|jgi:arylformamidase
MSFDPFKIRAVVPKFEALNDGYRTASAATRARHPVIADIAYGAAPRQKLDLFAPEGGGSGRPVHLFLHGGYWRAGQNESGHCYVIVVDT